MEKRKNPSNIFPMVLGVSVGLITIIFLDEIFQGLIALLFGAENIEFEFSNLNFHCTFTIPPETNLVYSFIIILASLFFVFVFLRFSTLLMIRSSLGRKRIFLIFFQIVLSGYLLMSVFYGAFVILFKANIENDWKRLINFIGIEGFGQMIFMFAMIILVTFYLHILSRKIKIYIDAHNK